MTNVLSALIQIQYIEHTFLYYQESKEFFFQNFKVV